MKALAQGVPAGQWQCWEENPWSPGAWYSAWYTKPQWLLGGSGGGESSLFLRDTWRLFPSCSAPAVSCSAPHHYCHWEWPCAYYRLCDSNALFPFLFRCNPFLLGKKLGLWKTFKDFVMWTAIQIINKGSGGFQWWKQLLFSSTKLIGWYVFLKLLLPSLGLNIHINTQHTALIYTLCSWLWKAQILDQGENVQPVSIPTGFSLD